MEPFEYKPLDLEGRSFRLLMLHQADVGDITCDIFEASLEPDSIIPYESLSYAWGSLDLSESITANGKTLHITKNLYSALEHLRRTDNRILWIDAICIDQTNLQERGHQVGQMGDIYRRAEQVLVWLGPSTYETKVLMQCLKSLQRECSRQADWKDLDSLREKWVSVEQKTDLDYAALLDIQRRGLNSLLDQSWFNRIWILQEVANARAAMVCCGKWSVRAHVFAAAPGLLGIAPSPQRQAVLDFMPGPSRKRAVPKKSLHALLRDFHASQATDPRDMVYALLGLTALGDDLLPDYTKSEAQLVRDVQSLLFFGEDFARRLGEFGSMRQFLSELPPYYATKVEPGYEPYDAMTRRLLRIESPNLTFSERWADGPFSWCTADTISLLLEREGGRLRFTGGMAAVLSWFPAQPGIGELVAGWMAGRDIEITQEGLEILVRAPNREIFTKMLEREGTSLRVTADMISEATWDLVGEEHDDQLDRVKTMMIFLLAHPKDKVTIEPNAVVWLAETADADVLELLLPRLRLQETREITQEVFCKTLDEMASIYDWDEETKARMSQRTAETLYKWKGQGIVASSQQSPHDWV